MTARSTVELSVSEAARVLGISPRTLRRQITQGTLSARKVGTGYLLRLKDLPLNDTQREASAKALAQLSKTVEAALPPQAPPVAAQATPPVSSAPGGRPYSLRSFKVWEAAVQALSQLEHGLTTLPVVPHGLQAASDAFLLGLEGLAVALYQFDPRRKREALEQARSQLSRTLARLLLAHAGLTAGGHPDPVSQTLIERCVESLEASVLPGISGLLSRLDRAKGGKGREGAQSE